MNTYPTFHTSLTIRVADDDYINVFAGKAGPADGPFAIINLGDSLNHASLHISAASWTALAAFAAALGEAIGAAYDKHMAAEITETWPDPAEAPDGSLIGS